MSSAASLKSNRSSSSSSSQTQPPQSEPEPEVQHSLRQFLVLLLARLVEPIAYVIPFVFINQMIEHLEPDVPKEDIGAYSGAIESLFALFQFLTSYRWGKLSDHPSVGRKPIIVVGLFFLGISVLLFGVATSYLWALCARVACGVLAGNGSVMRAALGEITPKSKEHVYYPIFATTFDVAIVLGPPLGGLLANPAQQCPGTWLANIKFLHQFPFFLPCAFSSAIAFLACFVVLFFFDETLEAKVNRRKHVENEQPKPRHQEADETSSLLPQHHTAEEVAPPPSSALQILRYPAVAQVLFAIFLQVILSLSFDSVFILFSYSSPKLGGLGLSSAGIATPFVIRGVLSIIFTAFCYGALQKHFGPSKLYTAFVSCWFATYSLPILMNRLVLSDHNNGTYVSPKGMVQPALMPYMAVDMLFYALGDAQFPLAMLAVNDSVPNKNILGAANGLAASISSLGRACGPFFANWAYTVSVKNDASAAVWIAMLVIVALAAVQTRWVHFKTQG